MTTLLPPGPKCYTTAAMQGDSPRPSPSDKARLHMEVHSRPHSLPTASHVGEEWCRRDPHYMALPQVPPHISLFIALLFLHLFCQEGGASVNPFATLPRLREGRKIIGDISAEGFLPR